MARSVFYYHKQNQTKHSKDDHLKDVVRQIYRKHKGCYGYRRITAQMKKMGYTINHKKVLKLMKLMDIQGKRNRRRYNSYKGEVGSLAENLINRDFSTDAPNVKWATDLTQMKVNNKWLYLSPILDMFNGEIVSYSLSNSPNTMLVCSMLEKAFDKVKSHDNIIIHSDRGIQYQTKEYHNLLRKHNVRPSMSRKGNCYDNAMMESFFATLKTELIYRQDFKSEEHLIQAIHEYIDYYNNIRIKSRLNGKSPVQFRLDKFAQ